MVYILLAWNAGSSRQGGRLCKVEAPPFAQANVSVGFKEELYNEWHHIIRFIKLHVHKRRNLFIR